MRKVMMWLRLEWIVLLVVGVYLNSFAVPFLLDDTAITENAGLRHWWNVPGLFNPPANSTLSGRPVANISFAINYAVSGPSLVGLHLGNLLIHIAAALTLMALIERMLCLPRFQSRYRTIAPWVAFATASLWAVHPANATAVSYLVQRTESLVSLFYLLTLYCFVRASGSMRPRLWWALAVIACLLGMGTKEVMVSAPIAVLLLDRVFLARDWKQVWRDRGQVHALMFATWAWLIFLVAGDPRGGSAGFDTEVSWVQYAVLQVGYWPAQVARSIIPSGMRFDHGPVLWPHPVIPPRVYWALAAVVILGIAIPVVYRFWYRKPVGWVMLTAAMIMAPSSSVIPIATQVHAEHRGYLMRAAVLLLVILWVAIVVKRRWLRRVAWGVWLCWLIAFSVMTMNFNDLLADPIELWADAANHHPLNARAYNNLGQALIDHSDGDEKQLRDAILILHRALELSPNDARVINNLALAHARLGENETAIELYDDAITIDPRNATAHNNRGAALRALGRDDEALEAFNNSLDASPGYRRAVYNRAMLLLDRGDVTAASADLYKLTRAWPDYAQGHYGLGRVHEAKGDLPSATASYERALHLSPNFAEAREHLEACRASAR